MVDEEFKRKLRGSRIAPQTIKAAKRIVEKGERVGKKATKNASRNIGLGGNRKMKYRAPKYNAKSFINKLYGGKRK